MKNKIEKIEFMEKSIGSIFKQEFWSPEIHNTIKRFKDIVNNNLVFEISDILDADYKYTHEAILYEVNTHGLFQFTLELKTVGSKHLKEDLKNSYNHYLRSRIVDMFANIDSASAIVITVDIYTLLYCYIVVSTIDIDLKEVMIEGLLYTIQSYEFYNGNDSLSILLEDLREDLWKKMKSL